jgi:uncharacterized protein
MNYAEEALLFSCEGESLLGILAVPAVPQETAVVIIVGGPQYRAGSHRHFVLLARQLAEEGYPVLRFDYRGMGDSTGDSRSFEHVSPDIGAAIDVLQMRLPSVKRVALWGLCDGASAALLYCGERADPRVAGLCLLNPWVRSEAGLAKTHLKHYYGRRLFEAAFWMKLVRGQVGLEAASAAFGSVASILRARQSRVQSLPPFQERMALAWHSFRGSVLLLLSGDDYTAMEFIEHVKGNPSWAGCLEGARSETQDLPHADHTLSKRADMQICAQATASWLERQAAA